jgi:hypothetical protein
MYVLEGGVGGGDALVFGPVLDEDNEATYTYCLSELF